MAEEWVVRQPRMTVVLLLIALGMLGAWLGVRAQERHTVWPTVVSATQVKSEDAPVAPPEALVDEPATPPDTLPPAIVATGNLEPVATDLKVPPKLPAELPAHPSKVEAQAPTAEAAPLPKPAPPVGPVKFPELPQVAPVPAFPSVPAIAEQPKQVIIPGPPPLPEAPEKLPPPRVKDSVPVVVPPPDLPNLDVSADKKVLPPALPRDLPKLEVSGDKNVLPPVLPRDLPKLDVSGDKNVLPPVLPRDLPNLEASGDKNVPPPAAGIGAKPLAPPVPQVDIKQPAKSPPAPPSAVSETPVPPPGLMPLPLIDVKQSAAPGPPKTPTPPEVNPAPVRPPAFLLVKPRRVEAQPHAAPPREAVPVLIDAPRALATPQASSAAQVTVEKRGPSVLRQGTSSTYQIIVRNRGAAPSGSVTVVDEIPGSARVVAADPAPAQQGDKAIWTLPPLPANSETILKLELEATGSGDFVGNTTVFVSAASATTHAKVERDPTATVVSAGPVAIVVRGPVGGAVGQQVVFEVQVTNRGQHVLGDLVLHAKLSEGLTHPAGNNIEADIGDLAPGVTKSFKVPTTAVRSGRQTAEVKITSAGGVDAKGQGFVLITANGLSIRTAPTSRLLQGRDGELNIEVTNLQAEGLRNVVIAGTLPENLEFVAASDRGIYQVTTRTVQWLIDQLAAGETQTVVLRLNGKMPGQFAQEVSVRAESLPETRAQSMVFVEGFADLVLKLTPRDQPLELGKETVCEVRVQNLGSSAAGGVQVQLALPPGLAPGYVQGPTAHRIQGRTIVFEPIGQLASRMQAVYHVGVTAQAAGDLRLRAQAVSEQAPAPVTREIALKVYRD